MAIDKAGKLRRQQGEADTGLFQRAFVRLQTKIDLVILLVFLIILFLVLDK